MKFQTMNWVRISVSLLHIMLYFLHLASIVCFPLAGLSGLAKELLSDFADSLPGIDEAKSFMQVMGLVISTAHRKHKHTEFCLTLVIDI